jgi:Ca2+-binding EF-hand superfamily protein
VAHVWCALHVCLFLIFFSSAYLSALIASTSFSQVLEWDEFWRFMHDLELNLSDEEIVKLRQKADVNKDGVIEWDEMVAVVQPLLGA